MGARSPGSIALINEVMDARLPGLAASAAPPAVGPVGLKGSSLSYARSDHTHETAVKWAGVGLKTNAAGVWTARLPPRFKAEPGIICSCRMSAGSYDYRATAVPAVPASAGWDVTVAWAKRKNNIALTIALGPLTIVADDVITSPVTFDVIAVENEPLS